MSEARRAEGQLLLSIRLTPSQAIASHAPALSLVSRFPLEPSLTLVL